MKKRDFLKTGAILTMGTVVAPFVGCNTPAPKDNSDETPDEQPQANPKMYELPALGYGFDALEPHIDAQTMEIHYGKHHAGYTRKLNKALEGSDKVNMDLLDIFAGLNDSEEHTAIRNNGGGYYNHQLFWDIIGPNGGGQPSGDLAAAINQSFGSYDNFANAFKEAAGGVFGSGWAWLAKDDAGKLIVTHTPNQDNPIMANLVDDKGMPILGLDVWEHAYYLKYKNMRKDYINAFFNIINWENVAKRFAM